MSSRPVSVVIVNWNVREFLERLLSSIFRFSRNGENTEVLVVDNASSDGSAAMIREKFPQVRLIANSDNKGFAAACNQGIKESGGEFVLLLNPDTEVIDDSTSRITEWMARHPQVGIAGGKVLNPDRTIQRDARRFPTPFSQFLILLKLHHIFPNLRPLRHYFARDFDYEKEQEIDQIIGAFFCMRKDMGLVFDESFFLWFEEIDLCKRAKEAGWKIMYVPSVSVIHHGGASFAKVFALRKQKYYNNSLANYAGKHWGVGWEWFFRALSPVSLSLAWLVQILRIKPRAYKRIV